MTRRRHPEEEAVADPTPEQLAINARTDAVAEKVDAAHAALERFLREANTNGAR